MSRRTPDPRSLAPGTDDPRLRSDSQHANPARVYIVRVWRPLAVPSQLRVSVRAVDEDASHEFAAVEDAVHFLAHDTKATAVAEGAGGAQR